MACRRSPVRARLAPPRDEGPEPPRERGFSLLGGFFLAAGRALNLGRVQARVPGIGGIPGVALGFAFESPRIRLVVRNQGRSRRRRWRAVSDGPLLLDSSETTLPCWARASMTAEPSTAARRAYELGRTLPSTSSLCDLHCGLACTFLRGLSGHP